MRSHHRPTLLKCPTVSQEGHKEQDGSNPLSSNQQQHDILGDLLYFVGKHEHQVPVNLHCYQLWRKKVNIYRLTCISVR